MVKYKSEVIGKGGISARVVACNYSVESNSEIITWELEYPRIIHAELMTHRVFTRNAASSRAIPVIRVLGQVWRNPAMPVHWGKNQPGMQAKQSLKGWRLPVVKGAWKLTAKFAAGIAWVMDKCGAHKQVANRITEPFQFIKVVLTTTEVNNWFWLRLHEDADPTIQELARCMLESVEASKVEYLKSGQWHMPYFESGVWHDGCGTSLEDALKISSSCCAQVSFRSLDDSLEKANKVFGRLIESEPVHASPTEHQATPMKPVPQGTLPHGCEPGVTHVGRDGRYWSGNFRGWIQHRQLIPNNAKM
jgi:hypothetical protein